MSKFVTTAAASAVFAGLIAFSGVATAQSSNNTLTREQVVTQLKDARASGELARIQSENGSFGPVEVGTSRVTRAQVIDELKRAQASGEMEVAFRDSYAHAFPLGNKSTKSSVTRAEVRAELYLARKNGEFARINGNDSHVGL